MVDFLGRSDRIDREFNYTNALGAPVHCEHTEILRRCRPETLERYGDVIDRLVFLDRQAYQTAMFDDRYDVVVYSTLNGDLSLGMYRLRGTDFVTTYHSFDEDATRPDVWPRLLASKPWLNQAFHRWFAERFEFLGADFRWTRSAKTCTGWPAASLRPSS